MGRKHRRVERQEKTLQVWTYEQARAAIPYLAAIVRSIRERRLESIRAHHTADRLAAAPGRPDRQRIITLEDARRDVQQADERLHDALQELLAMDVYALDPVQGLALVPFVQGDQLAWFIYDLFDQDPLRFWRYHTDPLTKRRPLSEATEQAKTSFAV